MATTYADTAPNAQTEAVQAATHGHIQQVVNNALKNVPFTMPNITVPTFPHREFSITQFGAVPNSNYINTAAINDAITAAAKAGGGEVIIPAGLWVTGPIVLQSNVNLHLAKGALVQFTGNHDAYP